VLIVVFAALASVVSRIFAAAPAPFVGLGAKLRGAVSGLLDDRVDAGQLDFAG
jgi:hypothetical protein